MICPMVNEKDAKEFAQRYLPQCAQVDAYIPIHTENVVRVARLIAERTGLNIDEAAATAWLHDIGYCAGTKKGHAAHSLKLCQEAALPLSPGQADAIANHGNGATATTPLGHALKLADKLSLLDFELVRLSFPNELKDLQAILPMIDNAVASYIASR
jgi:HD superfamily phosphodiesterase